MYRIIARNEKIFHYIAINKKDIVSLKNPEKAFSTESIIDAVSALTEFVYNNRTRHYASIEILESLSDTAKAKIKAAPTMSMFDEEEGNVRSNDRQGVSGEEQDVDSGREEELSEVPDTPSSSSITGTLF